MSTVVIDKKTYEPIKFSGTASEYFRIWIVNLALTVVTLGIYSAWAKVRKERYFYTHTKVADSAFDYHANPVSILIGRIIAVVMLGAYFGSGYIHPLAPFAVLILIFLISPWLVVRSRIFRMRVSSYRGIRFSFEPAYAEAFKVYYLAGLVTVVSFGLATGTANYMRNKFVVSHSGFGRTGFSFGGEHSGFVAIFWKFVGLSFLMGVIAIAVMSILLPLMPRPGADGNVSVSAQMAFFILQLPLLVGYLAVFVYYQVRLRNYVWNTSTLGKNSFLSTLSALEMFVIYLTNIVAIVFSLGLMTPWAQIRLAQYRAEHLEIALADDWQSYLAAGGEEGSALGEEVGQAFDVGVDIGF